MGMAWENFDINIETLKGLGLFIIHMVSFIKTSLLR